MLQHDWISIEPEVSTGILTMTDGEVTVGIIKEIGPGYWADNGSFVEINRNFMVGDKILFNQHLTYEVNGLKIYRVRGRDVIEVLSDKV